MLGLYGLGSLELGGKLLTNLLQTGPFLFQISLKVFIGAFEFLEFFFFFLRQVLPVLPLLFFLLQALLQALAVLSQLVHLLHHLQKLLFLLLHLLGQLSHLVCVNFCNFNGFLLFSLLDFLLFWNISFDRLRSELFHTYPRPPFITLAWLGHCPNTPISFLLSNLRPLLLLRLLLSAEDRAFLGGLLP
mmetsp:Transcript_13061/g.12909  ORF Transcript_13061/g.12909 Transcript_13061/m.12909 type:complete len:188 (-) Transcript_13061:951-1514(-)